MFKAIGYKGISVRSIVGVLVCMMLSVGHAQASLKMEVCNSCYSSAAFAYRAEQFSIQNNPFLQGIDRVHVVNVISADARHFEVERWLDQSVSPQGEDAAVATGSTSLSVGFPMAHASPIPLDPTVHAHILEAIAAVHQFVETSSNVHVGDDVELGFDSAVDLIGPEDSPAGLRRNALKNAINLHLNGNWAVIEVSVHDLARGMARKFLFDSDVEVLSNITVKFNDGTEIEVNVERILDGMQGSNIFYELDVRLDSIKGPGLNAAPLTPGQFAGFEFSGHHLTIEALITLANMYGIPVVGSGGGSGAGSDGRMECEIDGPDIKCRVIYDSP